VDRLFKSQEVQMTASDERAALRSICACTVRISQEEVSDFCSVLSLADRVFVAGSADATTVAALFRLGLAEFGLMPTSLTSRRCVTSNRPTPSSRSPDHSRMRP